MKTVLRLLPFILLIVSCKKKEEDYETLVKRIQNKKWILSYVRKVSDAGSTVIDSVVGRQPYQMDDYTIWAPDHKYITYDNVVLDPNATSAIIDSGVYAWNDNVFVSQSTVTTSFVNFDFESVADNEICFSLHYHSGGQSYIYYKRID